MHRKRLVKILLQLILFIAISPAFALQIASNPVNGEQRTAIEKQIQSFKALYPHIKIEHKGFEHEYYKNNIEAWLKGGSNHQIYFWFGGDRLRAFAENGLLTDLSKIWRNKKLNKLFPKAATGNVTFNQKPYALPLNYYQWGIYYRKSLFEKFNLQAPKTWEEFLQVGEKLKENNIIPLTLGNKGHWPAAGWFDYLNLRINGKEFHLQLLRGETSFNDPRVFEVFRTWDYLLEKDFFVSNNGDISWKAALPYLYHNKAGMMLMGNFFLSSVPEALRDDFYYFQFPQIKPNIPTIETAPMDVLIVAKGEEANPNVSLFINHMASSSAQGQLASAMNMIPTNQFSSLDPKSLIAKGSEMLGGADGLTQFFDRDSKPDFSKAAMRTLAKFVMKQSNVENTIKELEEARKEFLLD